MNIYGLIFHEWKRQVHTIVSPIAIPRHLNEWNLDTIKNHVEKGFLETKKLEFKLAIEGNDANENSGNIKLLVLLKIPMCCLLL
jgi:hypothetical protein